MRGQVKFRDPLIVNQALVPTGGDVNEQKTSLKAIKVPWIGRPSFRDGTFSGIARRRIHRYGGYSGLRSHFRGGVRRLRGELPYKFDRSQVSRQRRYQQAAAVRRPGNVQAPYHGVRYLPEAIFLSFPDPQFGLSAVPI